MEPMHDPTISSPLFGGLTGATLEVPELEIVPGLIVRGTFAHIFSAYMVAFDKPARPDAHHPGPWIAARGGIAFDVEIEVALREGACPASFDRLNSIWWLVALLRLRSTAALRVPVLSTSAFSLAPRQTSQPAMWAMEVQAHSVLIAHPPSPLITLADLEWVRSVYVTGGIMMADPRFNRAFRLFDSLRWAHDVRAAVTLTWSSLEAVLQPGRQGIGKALAISIAAFLEDQREDRNRLFAAIAAAYENRGVITHAAAHGSTEQTVVTFNVARRFFSRCLENGALPTYDDLSAAWKSGTAARATMVVR